MLDSPTPRTFAVAFSVVALLASALAPAIAGGVPDDLPGADRIFADQAAALAASGLGRDRVIILTPLGTRGGVTLYQLASAAGEGFFYAFVATGDEQPAALAWVDGAEVVLPEDGSPANEPGLPQAKASWCQVDGGFDDTLGLYRCCSGVAVSGSTVCVNEADYGTTWDSCSHVCGTRLVGGCVPSGGVDDTLSRTRCCSNSAVSGSTRCLDAADFGTDWRSCIHTCN